MLSTSLQLFRLWWQVLYRVCWPTSLLVSWSGSVAEDSVCPRKLLLWNMFSKFGHRSTFLGWSTGLWNLISHGLAAESMEWPAIHCSPHHHRWGGKIKGAVALLSVLYFEPLEICPPLGWELELKFSQWTITFFKNEIIVVAWVFLKIFVSMQRHPCSR